MDFISSCDDMMIPVKSLKKRISDAIKALKGQATSHEDDTVANLTKKYESELKVLEDALSEDVSNQFDLENKITVLQENVHTWEKSNMNLKKECDSLKSKRNIDKEEIDRLNQKINNLIQQEKDRISKEMEIAKGNLARKNRGIVSDKWGYVEFTIKGYPQLQKSLSLVQPAIKEIRSNDNNTPALSKLAEEATNQQSIVKAIFKHSDQDSAKKNPKEYGKDTICNFMNGILQDVRKLNSLEKDLRGVYGLNQSTSGKATVNSDISNSENINLLFASLMKLIASMESYASLLNKVISLKGIYRPHNQIGYRNYKGAFNYHTKNTKHNDDMWY